MKRQTSVPMASDCAHKRISVLGTEFISPRCWKPKSCVHVDTEMNLSSAEVGSRMRLMSMMKKISRCC